MRNTQIGILVWISAIQVCLLGECCLTLQSKFLPGKDLKVSAPNAISHSGKVLNNVTDNLVEE